MLKYSKITVCKVLLSKLYTVLLGVINTLGGTEPITITLLVLVLFSAMVQG